MQCYKELFEIGDTFTKNVEVEALFQEIPPLSLLYSAINYNYNFTVFIKY